MKSIFDKNANSFDLIRLLAALAVIYSHSYVWSGGAEAISRLTNVTHAGELSVVIFFFISGALVTKSLQRSSIMGYVIKRVARIYPALIICCFLVAFVMTWVFGGMSFTQVLNDPQVLKYFGYNAIGVWNVHVIDSAFQGHPTQALNGSLWSITLELRLYLVLAMLAMLGLVRNVAIRCTTLILLVIAACYSPNALPLVGDNHALYGAAHFSTFAVIFFAGALFYSLEEKIAPRYTAIWLVSAFVLVIGKNTEIYRNAIFFFTITSVLVIARWPLLIQKIKIRHDYSYGVYLYGWPSQQIAYKLLRDMGEASAFKITLLASLIAIALAVASWHLIEKRAIRWGQRLARWFDERRTHFATPDA